MRIGYARVSTIDQSPALQVDALKAAGCERIFQETASGARTDRPQLAAAIKFLREGDMLIVWKLDRLARSLEQLIATIRNLNERGIGFIAVTNQIDTTTPQGRFTFHLFGALAEFEREIIRERTEAGLRAARARGAQFGRPRLMSMDKMAKARKLARQDLKSAAIASEIGISIATLYRYLPEIKARARRLGSTEAKRH